MSVSATNCPRCHQPVVAPAGGRGRRLCPHCYSTFYTDPIPMPGRARTALVFGTAIVVVIAAIFIFVVWSFSVYDYGSDMWDEEAERLAEENRKKKKAELSPRVFRSEKYGFEITFPRSKIKEAGLALTCEIDGGSCSFYTHELPGSDEYRVGRYAGRFREDLEGHSVEEWRLGTTKACLVRYHFSPGAGMPRSYVAKFEVVTNSHVFVATCSRAGTQLGDRDFAFLLSFRLLDGPDAGKVPQKAE